MAGLSCGVQFIRNNFIPIALEYKNYSSKTSYYINVNEDIDIIKLDKMEFIIKK